MLSCTYISAFALPYNTQKKLIYSKRAPKIMKFCMESYYHQKSLCEKFEMISWLLICTLLTNIIIHHEGTYSSTMKLTNGIIHHEFWKFDSFCWFALLSLNDRTIQHSCGADLPIEITAITRKNISLSPNSISYQHLYFNPLGRALMIHITIFSYKSPDDLEIGTSRSIWNVFSVSFLCIITS